MMHNIPSILEHRTTAQAIEFIGNHYLETENYFELLGYAWVERAPYSQVRRLERYLSLLGKGHFNAENLKPDSDYQCKGLVD